VGWCPAALAALAAAACGGQRTPAEEAIRVLGGIRAFEARLADTRDWVRCDGLVPDTALVPIPVSCPGFRLADDALAAASRAAVALQRSAAENADARRRAAVVDLVAGAREPAMRESALRRLAEVAARAPSASALNDLAVAWTVRAAAEQDPAHLFHALTWLERALVLDPRHRAARFNRALVLERLSLRGETLDAWAAYLVLDDGSDWAGEARGRLEALQAMIARAVADRARVAELVEAGAAPAGAEREPLAGVWPQAARQYALEESTTCWASAWLDARARDAAACLAVMRSLGAALARTNGDRNALDAAAILESAGADAARAERLARGLVRFAEGRVAFEAGNFADSEGPLREALALLPRDAGPLRWQPETLEGVIAMYRTDYEAAERVFNGQIARIDAAAYPGAWALAQWGLGLSLARRGRFAQAAPHYDAAGDVHGRLGETESEAAMLFLSGEVAALLGQHGRGVALLARSLRHLADYPGSDQLHNMLLNFGDRVAAAGFDEAAVALHAEGTRVARRTGRTKDPVEALTWLGRAETRLGRYDDAETHLSEARAALPAVTDPIMHDRLDVEIVRGEAALQLAQDPGHASATIGRAVDYFEHGSLAVGLLSVLAMRAEARLAAADSFGAMADLERAVALADREAAGADEGTRFTLFEAATPAFDELIAVRIARGDTLGAFADLERSRGGRPVRDLSGRLPPGIAVLEWALLADRLLAWVATAGGIRFHESEIDAAELVSLIDRFENLLRQAEDSAAILELAGDLHERLITPVAAALGGTVEIVIVADKDLHRLPFAALRDRRTGRWLVEDYTLRMLPSAGLIADPVESSEPGAGARGASSREGVFLVGDPAFDPAAFPELRRLPYAAREIADVSAHYGDTRVLQGADATPSAVIAGIRGQRVFHFAGHARFRPDNPDLSFLLLARGTGEDAGMLFGRDIRALDLSGVKLIVLSACETLTTQATRTGGFGGLAGAFLAAGAGGVVGTLWEAGDRSTAALMSAFHRGFSAGLDPARALRAAQIEMMASADRALRAPGTWSAFRYQGR
jgi:CHAT domain-containing protein